MLSLLTMTLALSYAVMRLEHTSVLVHSNERRHGDARRAALTGLEVALRRMHDANWVGVDSTTSGTLSATESFSVLYLTGDPRLAPGDDDYWRYPYRVTLISTGTAVDPSHAESVSTHQARAIVQLVPRAVYSTPPDWARMHDYRLYQWDDQNADVYIPFRIEGPVWLNHRLSFTGSDYGWSSTIRARYFSELNAMRLAGQPDYRPFTGPVSLPFSESTSTNLNLLQTSLGVTANDVSAWPEPDWSSVLQAANSYRLYPGGKSYNVPTVSGTIQAQTLTADPTTNPLGLRYASSDLTVGHNVTVQGTLRVGSKLFLDGTTVSIEPISMPAIEGTSDSIRLPAVVANRVEIDDLDVGATIKGTVVAWDRFETQQGSQTNVAVDVQGQLITGKLEIRGRNEWAAVPGTHVWALHLTLHELNPQASQCWVYLDSSCPGNWYFPQWVASKGILGAPKIVVRPLQSGLPTVVHWQDLSQPIYQPAAGDDGLRWDVLDWTESL